MRSRTRLSAALAAASTLGACAIGAFDSDKIPEEARRDHGSRKYVERSSGPASYHQLADEALAEEELETNNTQVIVAFYDMIFHEHRVAEAIRLYGGEVYVQHTPGAPNGWNALETYLEAYFRANPRCTSEIMHVIAQGDLVVLHVLAKDNPVERGRAVVDIFRLADGKIIEHWDVVQLIPAGAQNGNTMF